MPHVVLLLWRPLCIALLYKQTGEGEVLGGGLLICDCKTIFQRISSLLGWVPLVCSRWGRRCGTFLGRGIKVEDIRPIGEWPSPGIGWRALWRLQWAGLQKSLHTLAWTLLVPTAFLRLMACRGPHIPQEWGSCCFELYGERATSGVVTLKRAKKIFNSSVSVRPFSATLGLVL